MADRSLADVIREHKARVTPNFIVGEHLDFKPPAGMFPHYHLVPKERGANAKFRKMMWELGNSGKEEARQIRIMCAQDLLFWVNTFVFTYDPRRDEGDRNIPFITWPMQDSGFVEVKTYLGKKNMDIQKSRDLGWSWIILSAMDHKWHFGYDNAYLLVSYNEGLVDSRNDPDALMWKLDHLHGHLPRFLMPAGYTEDDRRLLHIFNPDRNNVFDGTATTENIGRAGRRQATLMDEFASFPRGYDKKAMSSAGATTNCVIYLTTPKGIGTAASMLKSRPERAVRHIRATWTDVPHRVKGLYRSENGVLEIVDKSYPFPPDYPFKLDGMWRSPYRDFEDERNPVEFLNRQEFDLDELAENHPFFDIPKLDATIKRDVRECLWRGEMGFDSDTFRPTGLIDIGNGPLRGWFNLVGTDRRPPIDRRYCVGCDVATGKAGSMSSNSSASVWDLKTRQKVAEYTTNCLTPEDFARVVIALCRFFAGDDPSGGALLIWEDNGPGGIFGKKVWEYGYRNIFYRRNEKSIAKKPSLIPGWASTRDNKLALFGEYRRALAGGEVINPSREALEECRFYTFSRGTVEYAGAYNTIDPTEEGENHGDRVVGDALGWKIVAENTKATPSGGGDKNNPHPNSLAYRRKLREEAKQRQDEDDDD